MVGGGVSGSYLVGWLLAWDSSADCIPVMVVTRKAICSFIDVCSSLIDECSSIIFSIWGLGFGVGWVGGLAVVWLVGSWEGFALSVPLFDCLAACLFFVLVDWLWGGGLGGLGVWAVFIVWLLEGFLFWLGLGLMVLSCCLVGA